MIGILLAAGSLARAEELAITVSYLSPDKPSPFHGQLLVKAANEGFTSVPFSEKIKISRLLVDGRSFPRTDAPFTGPEGLPVKGAWEGCLPLTDYLPETLAPGRHHLQLQIGNAFSEKISIHIKKPVPAAGSPEEAKRQAEDLKDVIPQGLLRSCVENWLTEQDGGLLQGHRTTRYYVEPNVKVLVTYEQAQPEPRVKGRIRIYTESRILD